MWRDWEIGKMLFQQLPGSRFSPVFEAFAAKSWGLLLGSMEACGYTTAA
jgi:hypothetical protein